MSDDALSLIHQCPGCSTSQAVWEDPDGWECDCGERLVCIDLRSESRVEVQALPTVEQLARAVQTARHGKDWPGVDEHCRREAAAILAALRDEP